MKHKKTKSTAVNTRYKVVAVDVVVVVIAVAKLLFLVVLTIPGNRRLQ